MNLVTEKYIDQKQEWWPKFGNHILAQYDSDTIIVYQAFKPSIAEYAVENQKYVATFIHFALSEIIFGDKKLA